MPLPEYHVEAGDTFLLQVTIKLESRVAAEYLQHRLRNLARHSQTTQDANHLLLSVEVLPSADMDLLLQKIALEVDQISLLPGRAGLAELLESRMIPAGKWLGKGPAELFGLLLDPGNAFGTGLHPSTRLAVSALSAIREIEGEFPESVLDVGCGTGILALVSARFGAGRVHGIDISNEALAVANRNVVANQYFDRITINDQPLDRITACFDLITANLTASVLTRLAPQFAGRLNPQGFLIVSGIQGRQAAEITAILNQSARFTVLKEYASGPWRAVLYRLA